MDPRRLTVLSLLVAATVLAATGPATARHPPVAACSVCTGIDEAAADHGVSVTHGTTEMTIRVYANASTRWTAHVHLDSGADRLRNDTLRRQIVADAVGFVDGTDPVYSVVERPERVRSRVENDTLVVTYWSDDAAHETLGVVRFDAFHASSPLLPFVSGGEGTAYTGADRLVLRAPPGYRVYGSYDTKSNETAVVWRGDSHGPDSGYIDRDTVVTFADPKNPLSWLRVWLARLFG